MSRATLVATAAAALAPWAITAFATPARPRRPLSTRVAAVLARVGHGVGLPTMPRGLAPTLAAAGLDDRWRVSDLLAIKVGAGIVLWLATLGVATVLGGHAGRLALVTGPLVGFVCPDLWLRRRARGRARRLALELPECVELLRVAVQAGLAPMHAIEAVGDRHGGLLGAELRALAARIGLGVPRAEALERFVARCPLPAIAVLTAALARTERHGSPLAPALAALAADVRAERVRVLHERAARAAPKVQLAIALLLVPGVVLLIAAALQATTAR